MAQPDSAARIAWDVDQRHRLGPDGPGQASVHDSTPDDLLVPDGFTRTLR